MGGNLTEKTPVTFRMFCFTRVKKRLEPDGFYIYYWLAFGVINNFERYTKISFPRKTLLLVANTILQWGKGINLHTPYHITQIMYTSCTCIIKPSPIEDLYIERTYCRFLFFSQVLTLSTPMLCIES